MIYISVHCIAIYQFMFEMLRENTYKVEFDLLADSICGKQQAEINTFRRYRRKSTPGDIRWQTAISPHPG